MRNKTHRLAIAAVCLLAGAPAFSQTATASRTKTHVQTLASDKFEGRLTGSPGEKLAGDYLIAELKRMPKGEALTAAQLPAFLTHKDEVMTQMREILANAPTRRPETDPARR